MNRRNFITSTSKTIGASSLLATFGNQLAPSNLVGEWETVRADFQLDTSKIQMAQFLLASHPSSVRKAIEKYRKGLDNNPVEYYESNFLGNELQLLKTIGDYLGSETGEVACQKNPVI